MRPSVPAVLLLIPLLAAPAAAQGLPTGADRFTLPDVFELEWASSPQISPDGRQVVFQRMSMDIMKDRERSSLWIMNADGTALRPLLAPGRDAASPRWSPDGSRLLYVTEVEGRSEIVLRWMDRGEEARLTHLAKGPGGLAWSPDGQWIAFTMFVP